MRIELAIIEQRVAAHGGFAA
jgi:TetR/AcrR family transcriptional regulator, transcriptional repressor for nem operon